MKKPGPDTLSTLLNVEIICAELQKLHNWIDDVIETDPEKAFEPAKLERSGKSLVFVDWQAERDFARSLAKRVAPAKIEVLGEESLVAGKSLAQQKGLCVLLDMVD
ncbi:MAG TPA: hypothetical protein VFA15_02290, partial [Nitrososphaera sp.]|nr:hypothetical protein [Nitrososphaera sp.]